MEYFKTFDGQGPRPNLCLLNCLKYPWSVHTKEVKMRKYGELLINGAIFLLGVVLLHQAGQIQTGASMSKGLDFIPKICAGLLAILGALMLAGDIVKLRRPAAATDGDAAVPVNYGMFFLNLAVLVVYVLLLQPVGFLITTAVYVAVQTYLFSPRTAKHLVFCPVAGIVTSVTVYFAFVSGFQLLLPSGILG